MSTAPVDTPNVRAADDEEDDDGPQIEFSRRKAIAFAVFIIVALLAIYLLLPQLAGLEDTWHRIEEGDPAWLALAFVFTLGSFGGYVALFQGVFVRAGSRINWRESYQITMAGLAATRLFAAGGAGGLVLTAWALGRSGMRKQVVADRTISFLVLQYVIYMLALIVCGFGLRYGLFPGSAPFTLTVIPAVLALVVTLLGFSMALVPTDFQRRLDAFAGRQGRIGRLAQRLATVPATISAGMRDALAHIRDRDPALLGAIAFWAFQIAVVWAAFHAFGDVPGGVGGVDGGMIGAFIAFGVDGGLALVAVLVYRAFVFWLPTLPGIVAYLQLRRTVERWRRHPAAA
jgi:uncharacterized membrane protein YbhN (UPF0104 family)